MWSRLRSQCTFSAEKETCSKPPDKEQIQKTTVDQWLCTYEDLEELVGQCHTEEALLSLAQSVADDSQKSTGAILDTAKVYDALLCR